MKTTVRKKTLSLKIIMSILLIGVVSGLSGALFHWCIANATSIRNNNPLLIFLLPFAGLISVLIYKKLHVLHVGTINVLDSINVDAPLPAQVTPAIFGGTLISHLFGASCGKEGAALQLGACTSVVVSRLFGLSDSERKMLSACGMSAFFSAVFGTPFGAAVFGTEVTGLRTHNLKERSLWLLPCLISSLISWGISASLGTHAESFPVNSVPSFTAESALKVLLLTLICAAVTYIFYKGLHLSERIALRGIRNDYLRIFVGGCVVVLLTVLSGTMHFNGGGIEIIESIFSGEDTPFMGFAYKIIFTLVSVACGFKGGEIVPTLYVGATLGSVLSGALGLDATFCSAIGMAGLFAGMTKCPVASLIIALEMFGIKGGVYLLAAVLVCTFLSGKGSLYIKNRK